MQTDPIGFVHYVNFLGQVICHPAGYVQLQWEAYPLAGPPFRDLLHQVKELWAQTGLRGLYTDHRGMAPLWTEDCAWFHTEWLPQIAAQTPGCRLALVEDAATLNTAALRAAVEQAGALGVTLACFEAEAPALAWLRAG
jgi:hypothetical protein